MSDLRESGSIEQDADMVILLHRDSVFDEDVRPGEADMAVAQSQNCRIQLNLAKSTATWQSHGSTANSVVVGRADRRVDRSAN